MLTFCIDDGENTNTISIALNCLFYFLLIDDDKPHSQAFLPNRLATHFQPLHLHDKHQHQHQLIVVRFVHHQS